MSITEQEIDGVTLIQVPTDVIIQYLAIRKLYTKYNVTESINNLKKKYDQFSFK